VEKRTGTVVDVSRHQASLSCRPCHAREINKANSCQNRTRWLDCSCRSQLAAATVHRQPSAGMHPLDVWTIIGISGPQGRRRPQPPGGRRDSLGGLVCVRGECMPGPQPDTAAWATAPGDDPCMACVFLFRILMHAGAAPSNK
jgi:hypothetical protein